MYRQRKQSSRYSSPNRRYGGNGRQRPRHARRSEDINIEMFIAKSKQQHAAQSLQPAQVVERTFSDFELEPRLKDQIAARGFTTPTLVQDKAIEPILAGRDVLGLAITGTGKTGAFLIPIIHNMLKNPGYKAFVITPTRELALQIQQEFQSFSNGMNLYSALCIGGTSKFAQRRVLAKPFNILIGTPGRLKDLLEQRAIDLLKYQVVVLDEVDRMLDMGFVPDIRFLLSQMSQDRQSLFFSATVSSRIEDLIKSFSQDLISISVKSTETSGNITQSIVKITNGTNKVEKLHELLITDEVEKTLIFGRTKWGVKHLTRDLNSRGFRADDIHGNKSQPQRQRALKNFRDNKIDILVATDVAARGLDIDNVTHVINYDLPDTYDDYVHRIGRTGRAGKKGTAVTFVDEKRHPHNRQ